jgi:hypothetical protein
MIVECDTELRPRADDCPCDGVGMVGRDFETQNVKLGQEKAAAGIY